MKLSKVLFLSASLLTLAACGGGEPEVNYTVAADEANLAYFVAKDLVGTRVKTKELSTSTGAFTYVEMSTEEFELQAGPGKFVLYCYTFGVRADSETGSPHISFFTADKDNKDKIKSRYGYKFEGLYQFTGERYAQPESSYTVTVENHLITDIQMESGMHMSDIWVDGKLRSGIDMLKEAVKNGLDYFTENNLNVVW